MPAIIGGTIVAGGALVGAGVTTWANLYASSQARREARRTEALNIKFAEEETGREESRFNRGLKLQQDDANFKRTQSVIDNITTMFQNNRQMTNQMMTHNRSRQ